MIEKLILALLVATKILRPYFQAHIIEVPTKQLMRQVLHKLEASQMGDGTQRVWHQIQFENDNYGAGASQFYS